MSVDLMSEAGRAEAERLARKLPATATLTTDADDQEGDEDRPFEEVYDAAVQRVVLARRQEAAAKTTAKLAREELGLAYDALSRLRPGRPIEDDDTNGAARPRQLPLR